MPEIVNLKRLAFFERYLTVWVFLCMVVGVAFGKIAPQLTSTFSKLEFVAGSHVNAPIAVLIWLMIYPMMLKVDFTALGGIARRNWRRNTPPDSSFSPPRPARRWFSSGAISPMAIRSTRWSRWL
jgi:dolichyl-phosphate-mannose--protein O-mannosyl transferase